LQNQWLEWRWRFANVLMCVGKKSAGKKNKFWVGKGILCGCFFSSILMNLTFITTLGSIAYNGKRIAEVREKESRNFQFLPNVSKMFFRELS